MVYRFTSPMATANPGHSRPVFGESVETSVRCPRLSYRNPHSRVTYTSPIRSDGTRLVSATASSNTETWFKVAETTPAPEQYSIPSNFHRSHRSIIMAPDVRPPPPKPKSGKPASGNSSPAKPKRPSMLSNIFSTKEPSTAAFIHMEEQLRKQQITSGRINPVGMPGVSSAKMPEKVPKVNSKWDGLPTVQRQRLRQEKQKVGMKSSSISRSTSTNRERSRSSAVHSSFGSRGGASERYRTYHGNMSTTSGVRSFVTIDNFDRYCPIATKSQSLRSHSFPNLQNKDISAAEDVPRVPTLPEQYCQYMSPRAYACSGALASEPSIEHGIFPAQEGTAMPGLARHSDAGVKTATNLESQVSLPIIDEGVAVLPESKNERKRSEFRGVEQVYLVTRDDMFLDLSPKVPPTHSPRPFLTSEPVPFGDHGRNKGEGNEAGQDPSRQSLRKSLKRFKPSSDTIPPTSAIGSNHGPECPLNTAQGRIGLNPYLRKDHLPAPCERQGLDMTTVKRPGLASDKRRRGRLPHSTSMSTLARFRRPNIFGLFGKTR